MPTTPHLIEELAPPLGILTLNRPDKRNALSSALRADLVAALARLAADPRVSVGVLLSEGPVFCAGFDLSEFGDRDPARMAAIFAEADAYHRAVGTFPKPLVAGIQGPAPAGGFDLAVLCDVRLAAPEATFAHPEIKFGAPPLFGPLREAIGGGLARDLILSGRKIDAAEAARIGLVSRVVAAERLREETLAEARRIAEAPLRTLKSVKAQIVASFSPGTFGTGF